MDSEMNRQERAWHLQQLMEATLTEKEREYHRDCLAWLDAEREQEAQHPVRARSPLQKLWQALTRRSVPERV